MNETELNEKRLELESLVSQYGEHMRLAEETLFTIVCELQRLSKSRCGARNRTRRRNRTTRRSSAAKFGIDQFWRFGQAELIESVQKPIAPGGNPRSPGRTCVDCRFGHFSKRGIPR